jgi:nicotinamidase-related amidase
MNTVAGAPSAGHLCGLVVVDPVKAFTQPVGSIGKIHPAEEFAVIRQTVARLASFAGDHEGPKVWVRSMYAPGQFSGGDLHHPLANLCTDPEDIDCEWDEQLAPPSGAIVVTKTDVDANTAAQFVETTEKMVGSVEALLVTGFWLTTCVAATAAFCAARLQGRLPVVVPLSLAAARVGLYDPSDDHPREVDVAHQIARLRSAGVHVCDSPVAYWASAGEM